MFNFLHTLRNFKNYYKFTQTICCNMDLFQYINDVIYGRPQNNFQSTNLFLSGLNFINVLHTAFTLVDPKSVKRYWRLKWVLTLWAATGVKAACKYVDEIDGRCRNWIVLTWSTMQHQQCNPSLPYFFLEAPLPLSLS